jgi:hypothetical protein
MTNNYWSPLTGSLDASARYDMFGFDFGVLDRQDRIAVEVDTNQGIYTLPYQTYANGTQSLGFLGFRATGLGEYITGFILTAEFGYGSLPGMTNVAVGHQGAFTATPEPSTLVSAGIAGLVGLGYAWHRRKSKVAA